MHVYLHVCAYLCIIYILCIYTHRDIYVAGREGAVLAAQAVLCLWTAGAEGSAWPALVFTAGLLVVAGRVCHWWVAWPLNTFCSCSVDMSYLLVCAWSFQYKVLSVLPGSGMGIAVSTPSTQKVSSWLYLYVWLYLYGCVWLHALFVFFLLACTS